MNRFDDAEIRQAILYVDRHPFGSLPRHTPLTPIGKIRILIILASLAISIQSCDNKSAEDYFGEAYTLQEKGKFTESIALLDKAIKQDSRFIAAYINRGADKSTLHDYKGAISDYQKVLGINPNNTLALFNIGNNFMRLSEYDKAVAYYEKAIHTENALNSFVHSMSKRTYNITHAKVGEYDYSVPKYEIYYERGIAHYELGEYEKSVLDFQFVLRMNFFPGSCYNMIGLCFSELGKNEKACIEFQKAIRLGNELAKINLKEICTRR